ncbi:kinase-like domain-containing protein [Bombardia bombarda]|uniref:Kinase-like domain-containing protein n=1 Tax=Bombardia bombarda TaxID=252184 RepID=A0AA39U241_9PEZI|nr:kinase-like domain-containing protein [Bombardia bombarda]
MSTPSVENAVLDPYNADPDKIPNTDRYRREPLYGRYRPKPDDFQPDPKHFMSTTAESLKYWESVLALCDASIRIYENPDNGRDVFALGGVIVKSSHLNPLYSQTYLDGTYADANEVQAIDLVRGALRDVRVPTIYFAGMINDLPVLVQERIPGVVLAVAWQYLSQTQKASFKQQAREILRQMQQLQPPASCTARRYIIPDPYPMSHRGIKRLENDILFFDKNKDIDLSFMHNDFTQSNIVVDNDRIVGLLDWEMAGYFGWKTAAKVHTECRGAHRRAYVALGLSEEKVNDLMFWQDLYEIDET